MNLYLARLRLNSNRTAIFWSSNPYRIHQRLLMAYDGEPRLLFRLEAKENGATILVQSHLTPDFERAFGEFHVLAAPPEWKAFDPQLTPGEKYRFRLLANPTVRREGKRLGLFHEEEQYSWLARKLTEGGMHLLHCVVQPGGYQYASRGPAKEETLQTHLAVLFEGQLRVDDAQKAVLTMAGGIGAAKAYGFGLLSLARPA